MSDPSQISPFTRSKCAGGQYCSATCEIHRRQRRARAPEFSDDDALPELPPTTTNGRKRTHLRRRRIEPVPSHNQEPAAHHYILIHFAILYIFASYVLFTLWKQQPPSSAQVSPPTQVSYTPEQCLTADHVDQMIKKAIDKYDADKTDVADYALESGGAEIVSTRCSQHYPHHNTKFSLNDLVPVLYTSNSPRIVISPSVYPGECWSFAGTNGHLVIKLSRTILPTMFTYEHTRKQLSPDLSINSAPKNFRIKSLRDASDLDGLILGEYVFDDLGEPLQQFVVQNPNPIPTQFIQVDILSNHGQSDYTCLYRFRVHGKLFSQLEYDSFRLD